ncbi:hypothetical protein AKO53_01435 [Brucella abortus]|nr:hypothetical protein BFL33_06330 [Brucella melitensis]KPZ83483.1 hypothetical protein AKO52_05605 [Brucella abortus]KPN37458.1 hypothetical protein ADS40_03690 [Brucella melitensis]KPN40968.1 hypothetical protein ADS37_00325 [Brucella melitensis]KPZ85072.1 hypothetical protein AKO51_05595 [Brucella abortus]
MSGVQALSILATPDTSMLQAASATGRTEPFLLPLSTGNPRSTQISQAACLLPAHSFRDGRHFKSIIQPECNKTIRIML